MDNEKSSYIAFCASDKAASLSLFMHAAWLDAVCTEGSWNVALARDKTGEITAAMTYKTYRKWGLTSITEPPLSPFAGVWLREKTFNKQYAAYFYVKNALTELAQQLPKVHRAVLRTHFSLKDAQPFYWADWLTTVRYTYVLDLKNKKTIYDNFNDNTQRNIRKCTQYLNIVKSNDIHKFVEINDLTYQRQNMKNPIPNDIWLKADTFLRENGQKNIYFALNTEGGVEGAIYIIYDKKTAYYMGGSATEKGRKEGAMHGLLWQAIQEAAAEKECTFFDFEGSMLHGVEPFFRGFGGELTPYIQISKYTVFANLLSILRKFFS